MVVVSFGEDKPVSLGWGGALCSDDLRARIACGLEGPPLFERATPFVPTAVPPPSPSVLRRADSAAQSQLIQRLALAARLSRHLTDLGGRLLGADVPTHCWQSFPLIMPTVEAAHVAAATAATFGLTARTLNSRPLPLTPLAINVGVRRPSDSPFQAIAERLVILMPPRQLPQHASQVTRWLHGACRTSSASPL